MLKNEKTDSFIAVHFFHLYRQLVHYIGQKSDLTRPFNRLSKLALMCGAGTCRTARQYLTALGEEAAELRRVLVVYMLAFIGAKLAYLFAFAIFNILVLFYHQGSFLLSLVILCFCSERQVAVTVV